MENPNNVAHHRGGCDLELRINVDVKLEEEPSSTSQEGTALKRKADDEVIDERELRRIRFFKMEARNKSKINGLIIKCDQNPVTSEDNNNNNNNSDNNQLDLNLSLAQPGHRPSDNTTTNNNNASVAREILTVKSQSKSQSKRNHVKKEITTPCCTNTTSSSPSLSLSRSPSPSALPTLVQDEDGWAIRKELKDSDIKLRQNRLFIEKKKVDYIMERLDEEEKKKVLNKGVQIDVVDVDTGDVFDLKFSYWQSAGSYVVNGKWHKEFVTRRGLKEKDIIGLRWDRDVEKKRLIFKVLEKATDTIVENN